MKTPPYINLLPKSLDWLTAVLLIVCFSVSTNALSSIACDSVPAKHAVMAAQLCQDKKFDAAKAEIELAVQNHTEKKDVYTWYIRGFIYKEIYKDTEWNDRQSVSRDKATESFLQSKRLVKEKGNQYNDDAALKYLAFTYYNDALLTANEFSVDNTAAGESLFSRFREIMSLIEPATSIQQYECEFLKVKGRSYYELWMNDVCNRALNEKAIAAFNAAYAINPDDCDIVYNMATAHFNIWVQAAEKEITCFEKKELDAHLADALLLLNKAEAICPDKIEITSAMVSVHRSLHDEEKAKYYNEKLTRLVNESSGKDNGK